MLPRLWEASRLVRIELKGSALNIHRLRSQERFD
jgi:hypothetical protein